MSIVLRSCNRVSQALRLGPTHRFMSVIVVNNDTDFKTHFDAQIAQDKLVVIDWHAVWCGPCKMVAPTFEKLSKDNPTKVFLKVDVDTCGESAQEHAIEAMPTFQFYRKGKKVHEIMGADPSKLSAAVAKY